MSTGGDNNRNRVVTDVEKMLRRVTLASVAVACVLIVIKLGAYLVTDSVALLSSLIDSTLDSFASLLNFFAVRHALTPADAEHRFGHGKAEPLAGLGQSAFIAGSSLFLIFESIYRLLHGTVITRGGIGIVVMVVSLLITIVLVVYQRYVLSRTHSLAIRADSLHYVSDIVLNLSVIAALVLSTYFKWSAADPLFALGIAAYIIYSVREIAANSLDQLMDRELPDEDRDRIKSVCLSHPEVRSMHDLRTRASGRDRFIQLHLELDPGLKLVQAHRIADEVEYELREAFPNTDIIIHEDPAGVEMPPAEA